MMSKWALERADNVMGSNNLKRAMVAALDCAYRDGERRGKERAAVACETSGAGDYSTAVGQEYGTLIRALPDEPPPGSTP